MGPRSLRGRLTLTFAIGATVLSLVLVALTYFGVRHVLVVSRQASDLEQAYVNAALVRSAVAQEPQNVPTLLTSLDAATTSSSLVRLNSTWIVGSPSISPSQVPSDIRLSRSTRVMRQVVIDRGIPVLVIAVPLPAVHATYFQRRELGDLNDTLSGLLNVLLLGAAVTSLLGAYAGRRVTRRAIAPLEDTAQAARRVARGDFKTRLPANAPDVEVATLAGAFNEMLEQLVERLERDARFAGDVSHELRSPLTTLAMASEVLRVHRHELSPEAAEALDLLTTDVQTFQSLVEDLLEMAKADAGTDDMVLETLSVSELLRQCVRAATRRHQLPDTTLIDETTTERFVTVDRRRFDRVVTNLLDNAYRYGAGTTAVTLEEQPGHVTVHVDDNGPGIEPAERQLVFERFYRGSGASSRGDARGTGLGLALVADHARRFSGTVTIGDSPLGGCRVTLTLPTVAEETE